MTECSTTIALTETVLTVALQEDSVSIQSDASSPVVVDFQESWLSVELASVEPVVIEVGVQGPRGVGDPVWGIRPDATLTYDADEQLVRIDYADGTYKDLTWVSGLLTQIQGENLDGDTVTKTLTYTDGVLTAVSTTVS